MWKRNEPRIAKTYLMKNNELFSYTKINFKYIMNLNIKHKTLKCLEEKIGEYVCDV